ncbi:hypothetical protein JS84_25140 [Vibrio vulnificus]|nr:hypothetical protein JS84_25140 [Vibrio vulnificus]
MAAKAACFALFFGFVTFVLKKGLQHPPPKPSARLTKPGSVWEKNQLRFPQYDAPYQIDHPDGRKTRHSPCSR